MRYDVVLAGVGGQGILTVSALLAEAAHRDGLEVKQSEIHGMSQRGGAVRAGVRIADTPIDSALIPTGSADLLLGLEPLEALRHAGDLGPTGRLVTAADPIDDIDDYPDVALIHAAIEAVPGALLVDAIALARKAGSHRAANVVVLGACAALLPVEVDTLESCVAAAFAPKGERMVETNLEAFAAGTAVAAGV
jgi:indolepyruvate ferredoxin oxidoreductase beta subunit